MAVWGRMSLSVLCKLENAVISSVEMQTACEAQPDQCRLISSIVSLRQMDDCSSGRALPAQQSSSHLSVASLHREQRKRGDTCSKEARKFVLRRKQSHQKQNKDLQVANVWLPSLVSWLTI
jgi:hypothetical protein